MGDNQYDVIVIGAGHNGLTAAAYLARAGKRVLVLERREREGGSLVTEEFGSFQADMLQSGSLRSGILRDLKLSLPAPHANTHFVSLLPEGQRLVLGAGLSESAESIRRFSSRDAERWPEFVRFMNRAAGFLEKANAVLIPPLPKPAWNESLDLLQLAAKLRLGGRKDMLNIIRAMAMSALELLEEYFESQVVRAAIATLGLHNVTLGPLSAGTAYNLVHNWWIRGGLAQSYTGSAGAVTQALAASVRAHGGEIRTGAEVSAITSDLYRCTGVRLADAEEISAPIVVSAVDPKRTFLRLAGAANLPPEFVWQVQSIKMRGSTAKVHLSLDHLPEGLQPGNTYVIAPSIPYLEKAYDEAKYGRISENPYLELTVGSNVISTHFQYAPYALAGAEWDELSSRPEEIAVRVLEGHFPGLRSSIIASKCLTPLDLERTYGLTEGDMNHGQLMLDQLFFMRPIPGYAGHHTPLDGLYLCGPGVHGGGGISGVSGRNAARVVLKALE